MSEARPAVSRKLAKSRRPLAQEAGRAKAFAMVLAGFSDKEIGAELGITDQAVYYWRRRHREEIEAAIAQAVSMVKDAAIVDRAYRIAEYQRLYDEVDAYQRENGLVEVAQRFDARTGDLIGEARSFASALPATKLAILKQVAMDSDQWPRAGLTINDNRTQILIRQVDGFKPEELG